MSIYEVAGQHFYGFKIHQEKENLICSFLIENGLDEYVFENVLVDKEIEPSPDAPLNYWELSEELKNEWRLEYKKWKDDFNEKVFHCKILKSGTDDGDDIVFYLIISESLMTTYAEYESAKEHICDELPLTKPCWKEQLKNCCEKFGIKFADPKWILTLAG